MQDKAKAYSRQKHILGIVNLLLPPLLLIVFIFLGIPTYIKFIARSFAPNTYLALLIFYALMSLFYTVMTMPLEYYAGFMLEHRFSLSNQTFKSWIKREGKKHIISSVISIPLVLSLYVFIRYWPLHWWLLTATFWFFISILVAKFFPILIIPLFYKYSPIKNEGLKQKLMQLSSKVGFETEGVYELNISKDTKKANAALMGMGKQKRIVLCDTLLKNFDEKEIEIVMAHELGHHKLKHILKSIVFSGLATLLMFFISNYIFLTLHDALDYTYLFDFESLVLIYAIIASLNIISGPIQNSYSRRLERDADMFALDITKNKDGFISTMKKLASQNLSDMNPGKFYEVILYNHPSISRRIAFAEAQDRKNKGIS